MSEESTTPDPVELTRQTSEAASRGELEWLSGGEYSPNAVLDTAGYGMGTFEGREAITGFLADWFSSFEDLKVGADEIIGLGNGVVLTCTTKKAVRSVVPATFECVPPWLGCG